MRVRTIVIAVVVVLAVGGLIWYLRRRSQVSQFYANGQPVGDAPILPPVTPTPGQPGFSWTDAHASAIGKTAQGTCVAYGGGQMCDAVGKVGTAVGKVYSQGLQKAGGAVYSGAKSVASKLKFW